MNKKTTLFIIILIIVGLFAFILVWNPKETEEGTQQNENIIKDNISGSLEFTLINMKELGNTLKPEDGIPEQYCYKSQKTDGKFIEVILKVKNIGDKNGNPQVVVISDSKHNTIDVGTFSCWVPEDEQIILGYHLMSPGEEKIFSFIAEIPLGSQDLILNILDNPYEEENLPSTKMNNVVEVKLGI